MKKLVFLMITSLTTLVNAQVDDLIRGTVILSGEIENPNSDTLNVLNENQDIVKTITLNKDNTFKDTLNVSEGFYRLNDKKESTPIYLKPKFDLHLTLNAKEFDETLKYEGKGANENNYLAKKALLEESFGQLNYYGYYARLSEENFLKLTDSLYNVEKKMLEKSVNLDNDFSFIESKTLEFQKLNKYSDFEGMKKFVTGDRNFKVSENFPNPFENIDLSNEKLLVSPYYLIYIKSYLRKKTKEKNNPADADFDYTLEYVKTIEKNVTNDVIKEELLYRVGKSGLNYAKNLDSVFYEIKPFLTNEKYLIDVTAAYNTLKKLEKGAVSPTFALNDVNGKLVSLNDLKGKLVYIDIWATWCLPCVKEIPSLLKLEELFEGKDIQFVSICISDTKARWKKMIEDKKLGGIQLFTPSEEISFLQDYAVDGIPRFILIDKNGNIIDANAKRPSNPKLQEEIERNL